MRKPIYRAILAVGTFSLILAIFSILSTSLDQSSFESNHKQSTSSEASNQQSNDFLGLPKESQILYDINSESLSTGVTFNPNTVSTDVSIVEDLITINAVNSTNSTKPPVLNAARLASTVQYIYNTIIDPTTPRLESFITTDKVVYRAGDVIFVEVLVMQSVTKNPFQATNDTGRIQVSMAIFDIYGNELAESMISASTQGPTVGFSYKIPEDTYYGDYAIQVRGKDIAPSQKLFQVRMNPNIQPEEVVQQAKFGVQIKIFGSNFNYGDMIYGKVVVMDLDTNKPAKVGGYVFINSMSNNTSASPQYLNQGQALFGLYASPDALNGTKFIIDAQVYLTLQDQVILNASVALPVGPQPTQQQIANQTKQDSLIQFDPSRLQIVYVTENMADLVVNTSQKVFFYVYLKGQNGLFGFKPITDEFFNITNAKVRAYQLLANNTIKDIVGNINSTYSGFGSFVYTHSLGFLPFIEFTIPGNAYQLNITEVPEAGLSDREVLEAKINGPRIFPNGTVRIPIEIDGLQSKRARLMLEQKINTNPDIFFVEQLRGFNFTQRDYETNMIYSYQEGFFTVGFEGMPPIMVFNSFPSPWNFTNTIGFAYQYMQGLMEVEPQPINLGNIRRNLEQYFNETDGQWYETQDQQNNSGPVPMPQIMNVVQIMFNASQVVDKFLQITIGELDNRFNNSLQQLNISDDQMSNYWIISNLFTQIPGTPAIEATYFDKYGPICDDKVIGNGGKNITPGALSGQGAINPKATTGLDITYTLQKKLLNNSENLVVSVSTNNYYDTSDLFFFAVKQKERFIHFEFQNFTKGAKDQLRTIEASKFNIPNGGILSANMYRVTDDYVTFANMTGNQSFCNLQNISQTLQNLTQEEAMSLNLTELMRIGQVLSGNLTAKITNIVDLIPIINISLPGFIKPCLAIDPMIVTSFLEQIGSIQFFKKPANIPKISITTNKQTYIAGEQVNVTVKVSPQAGLTFNATTLQYLQVLVNEDLNFGYIDTIGKSSLPGQIYFDNDADTKMWQFMQPDSLADHWFGQPANNSKDANLDIFLALQSLRYQTFETQALAVHLTKQSSSDNGIMGLSMDEMSRAFGLNFLRFAENQTADAINFNSSGGPVPVATTPAPTTRAAVTTKAAATTKAPSTTPSPTTKASTTTKSATTTKASGSTSSSTTKPPTTPAGSTQTVGGSTPPSGSTPASDSTPAAGSTPDVSGSTQPSGSTPNGSTAEPQGSTPAPMTTSQNGDSTNPPMDTGMPTMDPTGTNAPETTPSDNGENNGGNNGGMTVPFFDQSIFMFGGLPHDAFDYIRPRTQDFNQNIPKVLSNWTHDIPQDYNRGAAQDLSETLFWSTGARVKQDGTYNFTFKTSDLLSNFKIKVSTFGYAGMTFNTTSFRVVEAVKANLKMNDFMAVNDIFNYTLTISNLSPANLTVIPMIIDESTSDSLSVQFPLALKNVSNNNSTYFNVSGNNANWTTVVSVKALKVDRHAKLTIVLFAFGKDGMMYQLPIEQETNIIASGAQRNMYRFGKVSTQVYQTENPNYSEFNFNLPQADNFDTVDAEINFFTDIQSFFNEATADLFDEGEIFGSALEVVERLDLLALYYSKFVPFLAYAEQEQDIELLQQLYSVQAQIINRGQELYKQLQRFQQISGKNMNGYEYAPFNSTSGGSLALTMYTLRVLKDLQFLEMGMTDVVNSTWVQNLNNTFNNKRDKKGNVTLATSDNESVGRAPYNATFAFVMWQLADILADIRDNQTNMTGPHPVYNVSLLNLSMPLPNIPVQNQTNNTAPQQNSTTNTTTNQTAPVAPVDPRMTRIVFNLTLEYLQLQAQINKTLQPDNVNETKSDPFILAATILAINDYQPLDIFLVNCTKELLKYQNKTDGGFFQASRNMENFTYTGLNSFRNDKIVETTAAAIMALIKMNRDQDKEAINMATQWLKNQFKDGNFGGSLATTLALRALKLTASNSQSIQFISGKVQFTANQQVIAEQQIYGANSQPKFRWSDLNDTVKEQFIGQNVTFGIQLSSDFQLESSTQQDVTFTYSAKISYNDNQFKGNESIRDNQLNFTVVPANYNNGQLGNMSNNAVVNYTVIVQNLNTIRGQNGIIVNLKGASCLKLNQAALNQITGNSLAIQQNKVDNSTSDATLYIKGIARGETKQFTVSYNQVNRGKCQLRPSSAQYMNSGDEAVYAMPKF